MLDASLATLENLAVSTSVCELHVGTVVALSSLAACKHPNAPNVKSLGLAMGGMIRSLCQLIVKQHTLTRTSENFSRSERV